MFRGLHEHSIDAKGRTQCPARFREVLKKQAGEQEPEQLVITTGLDACLVAYAPAAWAAFETRLAGLSQFDPAVVRLKRIYVASASECEIDRHGRLLLPPPLRQYAGLHKDIVWAGMVTTCEIWDRSAWDARVQASRDDRAGIAQALTSLGL
ncbi:MAG: division/cell wall cluster transcriptional repressor MraZ [Deltaproteobacteria bacterium]|nr:MAG: division/cell wall cluster transcriptional repressor MraZ [Deltaproteobacteria bacterium]